MTNVKEKSSEKENKNNFTKHKKVLQIKEQVII